MRMRSTPPPNAGQLPKLSTIAALSFLAGIVLWFGGSCLVLSGGDNKSNGSPVVAPKATSASPAKTGGGTGTPLADRTSCNEIRGTQYRSDAERAWFQANCIQTPEPPPTSAPTTPTATPTRVP